MKRIVAIGIWWNRFEYELYRPGGSLITFGDYGRAWEYIYANDLPLGASAVEMYGIGG